MGSGTEGGTRGEDILMVLTGLLVAAGGNYLPETF